MRKEVETVKQKFLYQILRALLCVAAIGAVSAAIYFGPEIHRHFGTRYADADREIFKGTVTYNEGMLDDLAKYKYEYDGAEDDIEKEAIASLVRSRFANYDKRRIEHDDLIDFLEECGV